MIDQGAAYLELHGDICADEEAARDRSPIGPVRPKWQRVGGILWIRSIRGGRAHCRHGRGNGRPWRGRNICKKTTWHS